MSKVRVHVSVSIDGFIAGPHQSLQNPLGVGGPQLHQWAFVLEAWRRPQGLDGGEVNASTEVMEAHFRDIGAVVMGRRMFGGGEGPWDANPSWNGWWGDDPPFHAPVFVLTHHPRAPLLLSGGNRFTFVTEGFSAAMAQARAAAGEKDVSIAGGAQAVQQALAHGLVDEITLSIAPVLLGAGARLFENVPCPKLEQVRVIDAPGVTHVVYRVLR